MNKEITIRIAKIYYDKLKIDQYRFGFPSFQSLCNEIFYNTDLENLKYRDFDFNYEHSFKFKLNKKPYKKYNDFYEWKYAASKDSSKEKLTIEEKENLEKVASEDSKLFRAIFIDYLDKPSSQRERFLYKDNFDLIGKAMKEKKKLKIKYNNNEHIIETYFIKEIEGHPFNLIFSYSNIYKDKHYVTYHLSKINKIKLLKDEAWEHYDEKEMNNKKAKFELYETESKIIDIFIKLNQTGKFLFDRYDYNRPNDYIRTSNKKERESKQVLNLKNFKEKVSEIYPEVKNIKLQEEEYLYHIITSSFKIELYFTQFSNNFELLYPLELRNKFKSIFSEAFENHK